MKDVVKRALTGVVFLTVTVGSILLHQVAFTIVFGFITAMGLWEFYRICRNENIIVQKTLGTIIGTGLFVVTGLISMSNLPVSYQLLTLPLVYLIFIRELFRNHPKPFTNIAYTMLGIIYIALPFTLLNYIVKPGLDTDPLKYDTYKYVLLGYFVLVWVFDTGAYIFGVSFGKRKMFPSISPKKSWEGFVGGLIVSMLFAWLISLMQTKWLPELPFSLVDWFAIAFISVVIGTIGDLVESQLKRSVNIKDSGSLLPGHGGILDRFDSILISAPFVFIYLNFFTN